MSKVEWSAIEALVSHAFEGGAMPERQDLVDLAFAADASDEIVDALDSLPSRPVPSLEALKEHLANKALI